MTGLTGPTGRRIAGVSLKAYFGLEQTRTWLAEVAALGRDLAARGSDVELFVVPDFVSLGAAREVLAGSGVLLGAQDVFWEDSGAYTGEVTAPVLREAGCSLVEVGHAERRRLFGEDDAVTAAKAAAAQRAGLVPLVCVGEPTRAGVEAAVEQCEPQVRAVLDAVPADAEVLFAYEPVWAIGAAEPADPEYVVDVVTALRERTAGSAGRIRFLYGGSAGPGTFPRLASAVDGLFLGRFAHSVPNLATVVAEMSS